jgi:hypothetical protein
MAMTISKINQAASSGEWGGWSVREAGTGWVVEIESRITGTISGSRILVPYRLSDVARGEPLDAARNEYGTTHAQAVVHQARTDERCRVLRRGHEVW